VPYSSTKFIIDTHDEGQVDTIDGLSYQERTPFYFTELYCRLRPNNSIVLFDEPDLCFNTEAQTNIANILRGAGNNNQI
jgi:hypothetical protein